MSFVSVRNIYKTYAGATEPCAKGFNLDVQKGEILALLGESGCGKSTMLKIIAGLEDPDSGDVYIEEQTMAGLLPEKRPIAMVFQKALLFNHMTVEQNVNFALRVNHVMKKAELAKRTSAMLELVGLSGMEKKKATELSGGQEQRVSLARALMVEPKVVLLDEPLSALDTRLRETLQHQIRNINQQTGVTMIMVTHDQREARTMADHIAVMHNGAIEQYGTPDELFNTPATPYVAEFFNVSFAGATSHDCTHAGQESKLSCAASSSNSVNASALSSSFAAPAVMESDFLGIDKRIIQLAQAGIANAILDVEDLEYALQFSEYSPEAFYLNAKAREKGYAAAQGKGYLHAQIGVDANVCPGGCKYCTFSACNAKNASSFEHGASDYVLDTDSLVRLARAFDQANAHLISLMGTAALPFERWCEMVATVREAVSPDMPLMVNGPDFTLDQARALKEAGAQAAYHARRLFEGVITKLDPKTRMQTITNIHASGLALMTGVEPVWQDIDRHELALRIAEQAQLKPFAMGACGLSSVAGTQMEGVAPPTNAFVQLVGSLIRLVVPHETPIGGVGNAAWSDAGTDPRNRGKGQETEWILRDAHRVRKQLIKGGWSLPERPSLSWYEPGGIFDIR